MKALIPDKLYFKIGEVAQLSSLRPSVLRYWETEFESLHPQKSRSGQRLYTRNDLELVLEIKQLLHIEKLTIAGAKKKLGRQGKSIESTLERCPDRVIALINQVKEELTTIRNSL